MSYLVLARKYRPRTFTEMVGQEHVVQALSNALTTQRLHHAYLFTGTRGVGKTTVSRVLAKSLNCQGADGQGGITAEPCGVCQACSDIDAGRFVDYTELDAASNRGVDEVQSLLEQAVYKPVQGRFKVFMIDEVHMLTNTAFNAMLKTLEEPPETHKKCQSPCCRVVCNSICAPWPLRRCWSIWAMCCNKKRYLPNPKPCVCWPVQRVVPCAMP
jgi:DNA polymerase-3 subunit gamma/tau